MADSVEEFNEDVPEVIEQHLNEAGAGKKKKGETGPVYKVVGDAKVPVSKAHGKIWKGRRDAAIKAQSDHREACEEAIKYYHHDQMSHRDGRTPRVTGNQANARRVNGLLAETENVVFSQINTLVPALYSKNPEATFSSHKSSDEDRAFAKCVEKVVNSIINRKAAPGVNLKPKAKKAVVQSLLTNFAWFEVGYTLKQDSSEQALEDLQKIADELGKKELKSSQVEELEGQLMALEEQVDMLRPSGPFVRVVDFSSILVDPQSEESDHSDANWIMRSDFLQTQYLAARYGKKDGDAENTFKSIYEPTHVLLAADGEAGEDLKNFKLFNTDSDANKYGYKDKEAYDKAQYTKVWFVWDRVTRRVFMYNDKDWSWPIWVWDDPYHLDTFFPFVKLAFHVSPTLSITKGETTYYLDQQDAINDINDEFKRARQWVKRNILFNKNKANVEDIEAFLKGDDGTARGVDIPDGEKMGDVLFSMPPPAIQFKELFQKDDKYKAIDRITGTTDVLRGAQFKTNTTNQAIDNYNASTNMRIDEKIDAIEDAVGQVCWMLAQLCLQFMQADQIGALTDTDCAALWKPMTPSELNGQFSLICVGGSTQKPTSQAKKKEAMEIMQSLGQFASAAPGVVLETGLKIMEQAFDEVVFTSEDWEKLHQEIVMQASKAGAGPGGAGPSGGSGSPGGGAGAGNQPDPAVAMQIATQIVQSLSPKARKAIGHSIAAGVPFMEAVQHVMTLAQQHGAAGKQQQEQMQQQQQPQPQPQNPGR
jgi:hypothetical protein